MAHRILIVEDDESIRDLLAQVLAMEGYVPLSAATLDEAGKYLRRDGISLVITDLLVPTSPLLPTSPEKAWDLVAQLRRWAKDTPIVICTAHGKAGDEDPAERQVSDIVIKPFDLDDLVSRVERILKANERTVQRHPSIQPSSNRMAALEISTQGRFSGA